jgi:polyphosphate glucokinase
VKSNQNILVLDIGGNNVKAIDSNHTEPLKIPSGPEMSAARMVLAVKEATKGWNPSAISIGYPGPVSKGRIVSEPHNLAPGWMGFDFAEAFGCPVKIVNDAAMQALGSYEGGCMLFLGLGTGLGSAMIIDGVLAPMELAHLPYRKGKTFEDYVGQRGLLRMGKAAWLKHVQVVIEKLRTALEADYIVLGGGNSRKIEGKLPEGVRLGSNTYAFRGGQRLWTKAADWDYSKAGIVAPIVTPAPTPAPAQSAPAPVAAKPKTLAKKRTAPAKKKAPAARKGR